MFTISSIFSCATLTRALKYGLPTSLPKERIHDSRGIRAAGRIVGARRVPPGGHGPADDLLLRSRCLAGSHRFHLPSPRAATPLSGAAPADRPAQPRLPWRDRLGHGGGASPLHRVLCRL